LSLTSRRRRPLGRKEGILRDARLIIIATEGEITEKSYFEYLGRATSRIQVKVLGTKDGLSAPPHVLKRLRDYKKKNELAAEDELWLVIDKDRWPDQQLGQVASEAKRCNFRLAVSNPCFELWLFLHHAEASEEMIGKPCHYFESRIREFLGGFDPGNLNMLIFEPRIETAISRAETMDRMQDERWPIQTGTRVYKVVRSILSTKKDR
jgi:hypothetical protein